MAGIALLSYHLYKKGDIIDLQEPAGPVYQEENDAINITESSNIIIDRDANVLDSDIIKNNNPGYNGTDDTATDSSGDVQNTTFNQDYFKD